MEPSKGGMTFRNLWGEHGIPFRRCSAKSVRQGLKTLGYREHVGREISAIITKLVLCVDLRHCLIKGLSGGEWLRVAEVGVKSEIRAYKMCSTGQESRSGTRDGARA